MKLGRIDGYQSAQTGCWWSQFGQAFQFQVYTTPDYQRFFKQAYKLSEHGKEIMKQELRKYVNLGLIRRVKPTETGGGGVKMTTLGAFCKFSKN